MTAGVAAAWVPYVFLSVQTERFRQSKKTTGDRAC